MQSVGWGLITSGVVCDSGWDGVGDGPGASDPVDVFAHCGVNRLGARAAFQLGFKSSQPPPPPNSLTEASVC